MKNNRSRAHAPGFLNISVEEKVVHIVETVPELASAAGHHGAAHPRPKDALTGLHNEEMLRAEGPKLIERAMKRGDAGCVVMADLNGLQAVNDALGQGTGDKILRTVARLLNEAARGSDIVARIGNDEFVLILVGQARPQVNRLLSSVHERVSVLWPASASFESKGISAGIAWFPEEGHSLEMLMVQADFRMHIDKRNKRTEHILAQESLEAHAAFCPCEGS